MFTFFDILSIPVNVLGVQLTPHVQNFKTPLLPPFHSTLHKNSKNTQNEFEYEFEKVLIKPDKSSHQKYPKIAKISLNPSFLSIKPYTLSKSVIKSTNIVNFIPCCPVHLPLKYVIKINKIIHFYLHQ